MGNILFALQDMLELALMILEIIGVLVIVALMMTLIMAVCISIVRWIRNFRLEKRRKNTNKS